MPYGKGTYGSKVGRPKKKKYDKGGKFKGPSHDNGGIDINVEGGEIIINKNENGAAEKHGKKLLALNNNPDDYEIIKKNSKLIAKHGGEIPVFDARKRKGVK